jgi:uncharacterized protein YjbI with pentapeptide repeats
MKKLSLILAMALAAVINYSCGETDNAVNDGTMTLNVYDEDGSIKATSEKAGLLATFEAEPGKTISFGLKSVNDDIYGVVTSTDVFTFEVNNSKWTNTPDITVGDDGIVKIYGKSNFLGLNCKGLAPATFLLPSFENMEDLRVKDANISLVKLPEMNNLKTLYIDNTPVNEIDLSTAPNLNDLRIRIDSKSNYDAQLTNINLDNNPEITKLYITGVAAKPSALKTINLSKQTKLTELYLQNNNLSSVNMPSTYADLKKVNLSYNNLTEFDATKMPALTDLFLSNNQLEGVLDLTAAGTFDNVQIFGNKFTAVYVNGVKTNLSVDKNCMTFETLALLPAEKPTKFVYSPQAEIEAPLENGILDFTNQAFVNGVETSFTFVGAKEDVDYEMFAPGKFRFLNPVTNIKVQLTNTEFPDLTLETVTFSSDAASNEIFVWEKDDQGEYIVGGSLASVPTVSDVAPFTHKIGFWQHGYATIVIDGTIESLSKEKFNFIRVDLDEPLKKGMKINFTGFRDVLGELPSNLYVLFNICDKDPINYVPNTFTDDYLGKTTVGWNMPHIFNNLNNTSLKPDTYTLEVDNSLVGATGFKMVLGDMAETPIYLTKIVVLRK